MFIMVSMASVFQVCSSATFVFSCAIWKIWAFCWSKSLYFLQIEINVVELINYMIDFFVNKNKESIKLM